MKGGEFRKIDKLVAVSVEERKPALKESSFNDEVTNKGE